MVLTDALCHVRSFIGSHVLKTKLQPLFKPVDGYLRNFTKKIVKQLRHGACSHYR